MVHLEKKAVIFLESHLFLVLKLSHLIHVVLVRNQGFILKEKGWLAELEIKGFWDFEVEMVKKILHVQTLFDTFLEKLSLKLSARTANHVSGLTLDIPQKGKLIILGYHWILIHKHIDKR